LRLSVLSAGLLAGLVFSLSPAHAALNCAPDQFEKDAVATAAPLATGTTTTRAICQEPTPQPRTESPRDEDYFVFTASGSTAYTIQAVDLGAALVNDAFDRGGIQLGVAQLNANGTTTTIEQNRALNGDRLITAILPAGRYIVFASTNDTQIYPETNTMDVKTVQGSDGIYGVRLTESAPAPVVTAFTLSSTSVGGGKSATGTYTLSAPAPSGGMMVDVKSSHLYNAYPGNTYAPAGATKVSFPITTKRSSSDLRVTLTAWARVGPSKSIVLTVKR
jgi:hypothetical protein